MPPQYSNPLEALRKAQTIGPGRPRSPYERTFMENPYELPLDAPPRPDIAAGFGVGKGPEPLNLGPARPQVSNAMPAIEGLKTFGTGLETSAPYVRPGAGTPQQAASTFRTSQPEQKPGFTPDLAELFRLASRENVPIPGEKGLEYGVAPGASDYWKSRLGLRLGEEEFQTPAAQASREMEMYKLGGPERAARVAGQADIEQQREAGRGALAVAESKGQQAQDFMNMMNQARLGGANVSRVSAPGVGSVSFAQERRVPTALSQQVLAAKNEYIRARDSWGPGSGEREKEVYDLAIGQAVSAAPGSPEIKQLAIQALTNPELMDQPIDQIFDFSDADPAERQAIVDIMLNIRGF